MKRKVFNKEELQRMAEYTAADTATTRKTILEADGDAAQDAAIDRVQALKIQSAKIAHNLTVEDAGPTPRTKPAAAGKPARKRKTKAEREAEKAAAASAKVPPPPPA